MINKKGDIQIGTKPIVYGIAFPLLFVAAFLTILWVVYPSSSGISTIRPGLDDHIISAMLESCFTYYDEDIWRYVDEIDPEKFTIEVMESCYPAEENVKGYRLTLEYGDEKKTVQTSNWKGTIASATTKPITVHDNGIGKMRVEVQYAG